MGGWGAISLWNVRVCVCVTQDIFETSFYERRWTADQPPNPAEWRAFCTLSLRVCFCVIVQVIDARSNGNGANKNVALVKKVCVCVYARFPADGSGTPRNKKCHFGLRSHIGMFFFARTNERVEKGKLVCGKLLMAHMRSDNTSSASLLTRLEL